MDDGGSAYTPADGRNSNEGRRCKLIVGTAEGRNDTGGSVSEADVRGRQGERQRRKAGRPRPPVGRRAKI